MEFLRYFENIEDAIRARGVFLIHMDIYTPDGLNEIYALTNSPELLDGEWIELSDDDIDALLSRM